MIVICAWCSVEMGCKAPLDCNEVTHGMCAACLERSLASLDAATDQKAAA